MAARAGWGSAASSEAPTHDCRSWGWGTSTWEGWREDRQWHESAPRAAREADPRLWANPSSAGEAAGSKGKHELDLGALFQEHGKNLPLWQRHGLWKTDDPSALCRYVKMKVSKESMGRGGPWSERWKAWIRCSTHANYKKGSTPGDPLRYQGDDTHFVEDLVRSWDLVPEFWDYAEGVLQPKTEACKGQSKGAKRAFDSTGDSGVWGSPSARRRA